MKKKGFTLIELLVVIAIIALLMSILMPALAQVRKQAKEITCTMNLKQWGNAFSMWLADNDNNFMEGVNNKWFCALRPYYAAQLRTTIRPHEYKMRFCPLATRFGLSPAEPAEGAKDPFRAWQLRPKGSPGTTANVYDAYYWDGSYGTNSWIYISSYAQGWKNANVKNSGEIPMLLDSAEFGGRPESDDPPPKFDGDTANCTGAGYFMKQFSLNRHNGSVNGLFMDYSCRAVGIKELWSLRWHRTYNTSGDWTIAKTGEAPTGWPDWMKKFKDY